MKTIRIPRVKNLITARPEGMDFETYKALRKEQPKERGRMWQTCCQSNFYADADRGFAKVNLRLKV